LEREIGKTDSRKEKMKKGEPKDVGSAVRFAEGGGGWIPSGKEKTNPGKRGNEARG